MTAMAVHGLAGGHGLRHRGERIRLGLGILGDDPLVGAEQRHRVVLEARVQRSAAARVRPAAAVMTSVSGYASPLISQ